MLDCDRFVAAAAVSRVSASLILVVESLCFANGLSGSSWGSRWDSQVNLFFVLDCWRIGVGFSFFVSLSVSLFFTPSEFCVLSALSLSALSPPLISSEVRSLGLLGSGLCKPTPQAPMQKDSCRYSQNHPAHFSMVQGGETLAAL